MFLSYMPLYIIHVIEKSKIDEQHVNTRTWILEQKSKVTYSNLFVNFLNPIKHFKPYKGDVDRLW